MVISPSQNLHFGTTVSTGSPPEPQRFGFSRPIAGSEREDHDGIRLAG
jgi:hypothetical protein